MSDERAPNLSPPSTSAISLVIVIAFILACVATAKAAKVVPSERVTNFVIVREEARGDSAAVGRLRPGDEADLLSSEPAWHRVRLLDGTEGFVSKSWTRVTPDGFLAPSFEVHFLDVGTGDSAIIDIGDREIVIDGGDSARILRDYAAETGIINGPIELLVVTHADTDHWRGLTRLLGFDGAGGNPPGVLGHDGNTHFLPRRHPVAAVVGRVH